MVLRKRMAAGIICLKNENLKIVNMAKDNVKLKSGITVDLKKLLPKESKKLVTTT